MLKLIIIWCGVVKQIHFRIFRFYMPKMCGQFIQDVQGLQNNCKFPINGTLVFTSLFCFFQLVRHTFTTELQFYTHITTTTTYFCNLLEFIGRN